MVNFTYRRHIGLSRVANLAWVTTTSIIELKYSKSNLCRSKGHQCYFCHFVFGWSAKVFGRIRKSSLIFGGPRVSLCVSGLTADHYFGVQECSWLYWGYSGALWDVTGYYGMFQGCSGVVPGCSGGVPGMFRGVPGVFRGVPGCSGCVPGFTDTRWPCHLNTTKSEKS